MIKWYKHILIYHAQWSIIKMLIKKILKIERRQRNFLQNLESREEKEKWVSKILKFKRRKRSFFKSWKSRGEWETFPSILENREEKETWILASRENLNHFSSKISRDRDSCHCLPLSPLSPLSHLAPLFHFSTFPLFLFSSFPSPSNARTKHLLSHRQHSRMYRINR